MVEAMDMYDGTLIDGELVDTYGGDYTYLYVYYNRNEDGTVSFYERYLGAKDSDVAVVDDHDDIARYVGLLNAPA